MSRRRPRRRFSWQISFCQAAPGDKSSTVSPALTTARPLCAKQSKKRKKKEKIERICTTEAVLSAQQKQSYLHSKSSRVLTATLWTTTSFIVYIDFRLPYRAKIILKQRWLPAFGGGGGEGESKFAKGLQERFFFSSEQYKTIWNLSRQVSFSNYKRKSKQLMYTKTMKEMKRRVGISSHNLNSLN